MNAPSRNDTLTIATMAFVVMLSSGLSIAAVRPLLGERMHFSDAVLHGFMSVNMLGAAIGAPILAAWADRRRIHRTLVVGLALLDAALLYACTLPLAASAILALRIAQGATNVGVLSIVLGAMGRTADASARASRIGLAGGGIMFGVAFGPGLGGFLLRFGAAAPIRTAAALAVLVALIALVRPTALRETAGRTARASYVQMASRLLRRPAVVVPAALAFAERFTVGCFVVTFALYAHRVRGLSDAQTSLHYSLFLLPFALATYAFARAARRGSIKNLVTVGGVAYGVAFLAFGFVSGPILAVTLVVAGVASAMVYGPSLVSLSGVAESERATAFGLFHAAGCLGMLLGPAVAGMSSAALRGLGHDDASRFTAVFALAGVAQLTTLVLLRRSLEKLQPNMTRTEVERSAWLNSELVIRVDHEIPRSNDHV